MEPDALTPGSTPYYEYVYNNESDTQPTYWPLLITQLQTKRAANELYTDDPSQYITYSGSWQSLLVAREKEGRYKNFTLRAYSGDSFNFYISIPSGESSRYYSAPLTTSGNYSVLTEYGVETTAQQNPITFQAPDDNVRVYTLPNIKTVDWIRLHHQSVVSGETYRLYQFLPRTLIQVDDLEADVIDAVTIRVQDSIVIGPDMIGDKTLLGRKIVDGTLSGILLTDGTITGSKIQANTISGVLITAGTITGDKIAAATISGALITAGAITADKLNVTKLEAVSANTGDLNVNGALTVTSGVITAGLTRIDSNGIDIDSTGLVGLNDSLRIIGSGVTGGITGMSWYNRHYSSVNPVAAMGLDSVNVLSISMPRVGTGNVIQLDFDDTYGGQVKILDGGLDIVKGDLYVYNSTGTSIVSHIKNTGEGKFTSVISPVFLTQTTGSAGSPTYITTDPDSGMYGPGDGIIAFSTNSTERLRITSTPQVLIQGGSSASPALSFIDDTNTGLFRESSDVISLTAGGVTILSASSTGVSVDTSLSSFRSGNDAFANVLEFYKSRGTRQTPTAITAGDAVSLIRAYAYQSNNTYDEITRITSETLTNTDAGILRFYTAPTGGAVTERMRIASDGQILIQDNSVSNPALSFLNDPDTGFYRAEANAVRLSCGGVWSAYFDATRIMIPDGTVSTPGMSFINAQGTGLYNAGSNNIAMTHNGTERFRFYSGGQLSVDTTNANGQLTIEGGTRPTITLRQLNDANHFINFVCNTVNATTTPVNTGALGTYYGRARVQVNGTTRWIALYNT